MVSQSLGVALSRNIWRKVWLHGNHAAQTTALAGNDTALGGGVRYPVQQQYGVTKHRTVVNSIIQLTADEGESHTRITAIVHSTIEAQYNDR